MSIPQRLVKEIEGLPADFQERILKLVHFIKEEFLINKKGEPERKKINALLEVDKIAIETGISDFASQHDHYLYGVPRK